MRSALLALTASVLLAAPALAQNHEMMHGAPNDTARASVLAVVNSLFDGMRTGDSAKVRAAFHANAQLSTSVVRQGVPTVTFEQVADFAKAVGTPHAEQWDERISGEMVHIDQGMAMVWAPYTFRLGGKFSHCGVDLFTLARTDKGWKIVALMDTRQRTGCKEQ